MKKYSNDGNKFIKLDDVYSIEPDAFNGVILKFSELRTKKKKDGEKEEYEYYETNSSSYNAQSDVIDVDYKVVDVE